MSRYSSLTEKKIIQYEKEGRGKGTGKNYNPQIKVQDFASKGSMTRAYGEKTHRRHDVFSKLEKKYLYMMEYNPFVIDIQEQYPLKRANTLEIANKKGIKHPVDPKNKVSIIMTTDFLITKKDKNGIHKHARAIKSSSELKKKRVIDKLEIERSYWETQSIEWGIITELDLPEILIDNIQLIRTSPTDVKEFTESESDLEMLCNRMTELLMNNSDSSIAKVTDMLDCELGIDGSGLKIFYYLIMSHQIKVDMHKPLFTNLIINNIVLMDC